MRKFAFLVCIAAISCKNSDEQPQFHKDPDFFQFRLNPELGKKYSYSIINKSELEQEINGDEIDNSNALEMGVEYVFEKDTVPGYILTIGYNKFRLSIKAMDEKKELDAAKALSAVMPVDKMFAAFDDAVLTARTDTLGTVLSIGGVESIKNKMTELAGSDQEARQMLDGSLKQYLNEQFFKQLVEGNLKAISEKKMKVGDTISVSTPVGGELNITASVIYKLVSIKNGIAKIVSDAKIDIGEQHLTIDNTDIIASMKGKQSGTIEIETGSGMLLESESELNLKGTMQVTGSELPFKMKTLNTVSLNK